MYIDIQGGNMKRIWTLFLTLVVALALVACSSDSKPTGEVEKIEPVLEVGENDLYLITDVGTIDDKSFNQGSYEGLERYAKAVDRKAHYLQPLDDSKASYLSSIGEAVKEGAKVIVTPGFLFEPAVYEAQDTYPDVKFILVDGVPQPGDYSDLRTNDNVLSILYHEEQSGFLAGYAAVKEGFTNLGYMGGMAVPAVMRFGYGFVAGANHAAEEMGVDVTVRYTYLGNFNQDPEHTVQAASWYNSGVEIIFAAAGGAGNMVMRAAEDADKWMIGVDVDQKDESPKVLTSAMKNLQLSVFEATRSVYDDKWEGGQTLNLSVNDNGVQLSDDFSRFETFTKEDYDAIYKALQDNKDGITDAIPTDANTDGPGEIKLPKVKVEVID